MTATVQQRGEVLPFLLHTLNQTTAEECLFFIFLIPNLFLFTLDRRRRRQLKEAECLMMVPIMVRMVFHFELFLLVVMCDRASRQKTCYIKAQSLVKQQRVSNL